MKGVKFVDNPLSYNPRDTFVAHLSDINDKDQLFKELSYGLKFPEYFGNNWCALSDCLRDFNWIDQEGIVLVHDEVPKLDEITFNRYIQTLAEAVQDWKEGEEHYLEIVFSEKVENFVKRYLEEGHQRF